MPEWSKELLSPEWVTAVGTCVIPVALAVGPLLVWSLTRPAFRLSPNIDLSGNSRYLRLKVQNSGRINKARKVARKCVGRLIEIRDESGEFVRIPQLNFCWERHNQANPPHPIDIPKAPFEVHLDIAKYTTDDPGKIRLRVDAENQQLPGQFDYHTEFRELTLPAQTYFVLISLYTEDGFAKTQWYVLSQTAEGYTIAEGKPPKTR